MRWRFQPQGECETDRPNNIVSRAPESIFPADAISQARFDQVIMGGDGTDIDLEHIGNGSLGEDKSPSCQSLIWPD